MNALEQALGILQSREASAATLKRAVDEVRGFVRELDAESERGPAREAEILARMASAAIQKTLEALASLDSEGERRPHLRKIATHLAATLDARAIEMAAAERARDPAVVREVHREALFARVPVLFRTDFLAAQLGKAAYSRTPRPAGSHVAYARDFTVPRVLDMESIRCPGWPPRHGDFKRIEWPDSDVDEDGTIVGQLRELCQKSSVSEDEVARVLDRAQHVLLGEFAQVCSRIREHYPAGLPRFIALPAIGSLAMAAE